MECGFDTYKNALIENLVILFVFFCAVEPIYSFFKPIGFIFNNIKSLPHTGDLQTKVFQGHYLKHEEIVEFRNISLIDTVHFV